MIDILVGNTSKSFPFYKTLSQFSAPGPKMSQVPLIWFELYTASVKTDGSHELPVNSAFRGVTWNFLRHFSVNIEYNQPETKFRFWMTGFFTLHEASKRLELSDLSFNIEKELRYSPLTSTIQVYHFYLQVAPSCSAGQLLSHRHLLLLQVSVLLDYSTIKTMGEVLHTLPVYFSFLLVRHTLLPSCRIGARTGLHPIDILLQLWAIASRGHQSHAGSRSWKFYFFPFFQNSHPKRETSGHRPCCVSRDWIPSRDFLLCLIFCPCFGAFGVNLPNFIGSRAGGC